MRYPKQYVRERPDTYTGALTESYGWITSTKTRPALIAEAVQMVREHVELINDRKTLEEMLTFTRNEKGRPEAAPGCHDDLVISYGIVLSIRKQQSFTVEGEKQNYVKWTEDQYQDYYNGSQADREKMIALWGRPERL